MKWNKIVFYLRWFDFEGRGRKDARISDGRVLKSEMFTNKVFQAQSTGKKTKENKNPEIARMS